MELTSACQRYERNVHQIQARKTRHYRRTGVGCHMKQKQHRVVEKFVVQLALLIATLLFSE